MASITDPAPAETVALLQRLNEATAPMVPVKSDDNLLVGTWNIRALDRISPTWHTDHGDSPIRDFSDAACITEIIRRFDVIAIQEVRRSAQAFLRVLAGLGPGWAYLVTDVTRGRAGNYERLAFVFDTARVAPAGLACELVVAADEAGIAPDALQRQFARTPYAASFARNGRTFTLVTLHVVYGESPADRIPELAGIAQWLHDWDASRDVWGTDLIALGDFNIDRAGDPLYEAFTSTGLQPPDALNHVPRTIFDDPDPDAPADHRHYYDQLAWFPGSAFTLGCRNAGMIDFTTSGIPADSTVQLSWRISDHYPLWCEFTTSEPPAAGAPAGPAAS